MTQRFTPAIGGVEEHVQQLSTGLAERGHEVTVYTSDLERDRPFLRLAMKSQVSDPENVHVRRFTAMKFVDLPWGLGIVEPSMLPNAVGEEFDVVHAHTIGYWPTFVGAAKKLYDGTPLVITPHSNPGSRDYGFVDFRKIPLRSADRLIALTDGERRYLVSLGMKQNRIVVIPNGVSWKKFQSEDIGEVRGSGRVLFVGRIDIQHKGCDKLVEAMALVIRRIRHATLTLVGPDWGDAERVISLAKSLGIDGQVNYVGMVSEEEKFKHFAMADVCVLPSNIEPFGIVALEAMASGKPLVATNVGGLKELVRDGENGLLVPCRDEVRLADAITYLLSHPSVAARMGSIGRELAKNYSWRAVVGEVERLYRSLTRLENFDLHSWNGFS